MFSLTGFLWISLQLLPLLSTQGAPLSARIFGFGGTSSTTPAPISQETVSSQFLRPAQFSRVAYCSSSAVTSWNCGAPCQSLGGGIKVLQAGGDDGLVPMYFVAHDPTTGSIVVAHQGTDTNNILSVLNDAEFELVGLNSTRFPGTTEDIKVHDGFQRTFERTADGVLESVRSALVSTGANKVLVTGHSLGASIATLDAVLLKRNLDPSVEITTTVFGLPRVGNQEWANFVDSTLGESITHITNQNDPVPTVPPRFLGYQHPSGEAHINAVDGNGEVTDIVSCEGQENENCSEGNSPLKLSISNHAGPYLGNVSFGGKFCPL